MINEEDRKYNGIIVEYYRQDLIANKANERMRFFSEGKKESYEKEVAGLKFDAWCTDKTKSAWADTPKTRSELMKMIGEEF